MKTVNQTIKQTKSLLVLMTMSAMLWAFAPMGAHSFKISLDDKQVVEQYVGHNMIAPKIAIDPSENHKELVVGYSECGRTVSGRVLTAKNAENKVLKEWKFEGSTAGFKDAMKVGVKDLVALKPANGTVNLFYSSNDFPDGQQIATLQIGKGVSTASR